MLVSVLGNLGSGKTLFLTYIATKFKRQVYANYELKLPHYKPLKVIDLLKLPNNIEVFIDEGYTWLESRVSSKVLNRYLSYIVLQSRKRTINIYITAQLFSTVDLRFREQSDIIVVCSKHKEGFNYKMINKNTGKFISFLLPMDKAKEFFDFYDTYEIIEPYEKQRLEFQILQSDSEQLFNNAEKIAKIIKPNLKKITHQTVKLELLSNHFHKGYEPFVYAVLKRDEIING